MPKITMKVVFLLMISISINQIGNYAKIKYVHPKLIETPVETLSETPEKNKLVVSTVEKYGPDIAPNYGKAVCTELVIQVLEKIQELNNIDKKRIRIITDKNIQELLKEGSNIPKGVYFALIAKGIGTPIDNKAEVCEGDFVQFWTESWGHCGIVKTINPNMNEMELYSSYPSTNGYSIHTFNIPKYAYFVRLK